MRKFKWIILTLSVLFVFAQTAFAADLLTPRDNIDTLGKDGKAFKAGYINVMVMDEVADPGTPAANIGWLYAKDVGGTTTLYFETSAGATALAGASVAWDDVGDPDADTSISAGNYESTITSTINSANKATLNIVNTTADLTADVSLLELRFTDDGDANGFFIRGYDHASADLKFSIGVNGAFIIGDLTVGGYMLGASPLAFEGETADTVATTIAITDPTAARTLTIPDASGTVDLIASASHDYGAAHADWTLSVDEQRASYLSATNADDAVNVLLSAAIPGKTYMIYNNTGQVMTFKVTGQTGGTIAAGKRAFYVCAGTDVYEIWEQS